MENADLFVWSATEISGLDPEIACYHLIINPALKAVLLSVGAGSPRKKLRFPSRLSKTS